MGACLLLDSPTKVNIQAYVAFAEDGGEAPQVGGPVAEGLPPLAAGVQARGGDARRRPHRHRVIRRYAHSPGRRGCRDPVLAFLLAFRGVLGTGIRATAQREW